MKRLTAESVSFALLLLPLAAARAGPYFQVRDVSADSYLTAWLAGDPNSPWTAEYHGPISGNLDLQINQSFAAPDRYGHLWSESHIRIQPQSPSEQIRGWVLSDDAVGPGPQSYDCRAEMATTWQFLVGDQPVPFSAAVVQEFTMGHSELAIYDETDRQLVTRLQAIRESDLDVSEWKTSDAFEGALLPFHRYAMWTDSLAYNFDGTAGFDLSADGTLVMVPLPGTAALAMIGLAIIAALGARAERRFERHIQYKAISRMCRTRGRRGTGPRYWQGGPRAPGCGWAR